MGFSQRIYLFVFFRNFDHRLNVTCDALRVFGCVERNTVPLLVSVCFILPMFALFQSIEVQYVVFHKKNRTKTFGNAQNIFLAVLFSISKTSRLFMQSVSNILTRSFRLRRHNADLHIISSLLNGRSSFFFRRPFSWSISYFFRDRTSFHNPHSLRDAIAILTRAEQRD